MEPHSRYSQEIRSERYNPLSADDEKVLAERIRINDHSKEARNKLVCGSLRFVVLVAAKYQNAGLSMDDLIQEGNRGLLEAANRFDASKNFKFDSYAVWWIRRYILFALNEQGRSVKVPQHSGALSIKVKNVTRELEQRYQREPTDEEIARELEVDKKWINMLENTNHNVSLNSMIGEDDIELIGTLTYEEEKNNVDEDFVSELLERISERERNFIRKYHMSDYRVDLQEIADREGLSRERVRQVITNGIKKLRRITKKAEVYA